MTRIELCSIRDKFLQDIAKRKLEEKSELPMSFYRSGYIDGILDFFNEAAKQVGGFYGLRKEEKGKQEEITNANEKGVI